MVSAVEIERAGQPLTDGRVVHVFVDVATQATSEIPGRVREALVRWTAPVASG
jgi:acyl-CoA thioesterase FadM